MGSFSPLGNLGGKREGCVLLTGGPHVGGHSNYWASSDRRLPTPRKELYDIHLSGAGGAARHFYLDTSELRKACGRLEQLLWAALHWRTLWLLEL